MFWCQILTWLQSTGKLQSLGLQPRNTWAIQTITMTAFVSSICSYQLTHSLRQLSSVTPVEPWIPNFQVDDVKFDLVEDLFLASTQFEHSGKGTLWKLVFVCSLLWVSGPEKSASLQRSSTAGDLGTHMIIEPSVLVKADNLISGTWLVGI